MANRTEFDSYKIKNGKDGLRVVFNVKITPIAPLAELVKGFGYNDTVAMSEEDLSKRIKDDQAIGRSTQLEEKALKELQKAKTKAPKA